jgi:hypothetical protein
MDTWNDGPLAMAIAALRYYVTGYPLPTSLVFLWHVEAHACDGAPWWSGIDFVYDEMTGVPVTPPA